MPTEAAPRRPLVPDGERPDGGAAPFIPASLPVPAIPVSAGAMIFDRSGRLLILKPTYKSGWTIPGGVMEANGETPWDACRREVREECGLDVRSGRLACVDFRRPRPARPASSGKPAKPANPGGIRFLFDCGQLADVSFAAMVLQPAEISEYRLAERDAFQQWIERIKKQLEQERQQVEKVHWRESGSEPVDHTGKPYESFDEMVAGLDGPFVQGNLRSKCPNPRCGNHQRANSMQVFLLIVPSNDKDPICADIAGGDCGQLVYEVCLLCHSVLASNPCT
jgi:8-oxo-dGTP pyrophosphatase MutT (NUDIX family)